MADRGSPLLDLMSGYPMPEGSDPYYGQQVMPSSALSAYQPTWRDRIAQALMGDQRVSPERNRLVEGLVGSIGLGNTGTGLLDLTPAGVLMQAQEAWRGGDDRALAMALMPGPKPRQLLNNSSRSTTMYDPPTIARRPFDADYGPANAARSDPSGRLTHTIDGDRITAPYVAGRRMVGAGDEAITPAQFDAIATAATGRGATDAPPRRMGSDLGRTVVDRLTGRTKEVFLRNDLRGADRERVYAHELGHVVNDWATKAEGIPTKGLDRKHLEPLYNNLNNRNRGRAATPEDGLAASWSKPVDPSQFRYKDDDAPHEYMAEAIRAYMANPNYIKQAHPALALRVREYVNTHPELSRIVQFNAVPLAASMYGMDQVSQAMGETEKQNPLMQGY